MSLEAALAEHTAALKENTELLRILTGKASTAMEAAKAKADGADKPAAGEKATRTRKAKAPSAADMKTKAEEYLDVADEDQYAARKANLRAIVTKFGATKFTEIDEDKRQEALDLLADYEKKESRDVKEEDGDDDMI